MKILSKASVNAIEREIISAYNAVMQDVIGKWQMPVSTFTAVTDSLIKISVELGIDLTAMRQEQFKHLDNQIRSAEIRLETAKALGGPQNEPDN